MIAGMSDFLNEFPEFKQTLQPRREHADSFEAVLRRIEEEDLPERRVRFEQYLNESLVGDLLMLNRRLDEHIEAIESRISETNEALRRVEYADDTYVQLRLNVRPSLEATEFRRRLRDCFEYGIAPAPRSGWSSSTACALCSNASRVTLKALRGSRMFGRGTSLASKSCEGPTTRR